eukprot:403330961
MNIADLSKKLQNSQSLKGALSAKNLLSEHLKYRDSAKKDANKSKNLNLRESFKSISSNMMSDCELEKMESIGSVVAGQSYEIDWFDFETRMRKLIHEMIEPTVRKVNEDRDKIYKLKTDQDNHKRKLEDLEFAVIKTDNKTNVFEDIFRSLAKLETEIKVEQNRVDNEFDRTQAQIDNIHFELKNQNQMHQSLHSYVERIHSETQIFNQTFIGYKEKQIDSIANLQQDLTDQLDRHSKQMITLQVELSKEATQIKHHSNLLTKLDAMCHTQVQRTQELQGEITDNKSSFVNQGLYKKEMEEVEKRFDRMIIQLEDQINQNLGLHNFVDKYLPIRTQQQISDCLNTCLLDNEMRRKLFDFDKLKYSEFNTMILKDTGIHQLKQETERLKTHVLDSISGVKKPLQYQKSGNDAANDKPVNVTQQPTGYVSQLARNRMTSGIEEAGDSGFTGGSTKVYKSGQKRQFGVSSRLDSNQDGDEEYFNGDGAGSQTIRNRGLRERSSIMKRESSNNVQGLTSKAKQIQSPDTSINKMSQVGVSGQSPRKNLTTPRVNESLIQNMPSSAMGGTSFNATLSPNSTQQVSTPGDMIQGFNQIQMLQSPVQINLQETVLEKTEEDDIMSSYHQPDSNMVPVERLEEFQTELNKINENLQIQMKKLGYQMSSNSTQTYIEQENIKKNLYAVENQLQQAISQIQVEIEQFFRARKRDKSDQNLLLESLTVKIDSCTSQLSANQNAISGLSTLVVLLIEICQMQLLAEDQDEQDRNTIALLGYKDNTSDSVQKQKHAHQNYQTIQTSNDSSANINSSKDNQNNFPLPVGQGSNKKRSQSNAQNQSKQNNTSQSILLDETYNSQPTKFLQDSSVMNQSNNGGGTKKNLLQLDPKCLSCSGQGSTLISTFKMACLAYAPTTVIYRNIEFTRPQLSFFRKFLLGQCNKIVITSQPFTDFNLSTKKLFDDTYLYFLDLHQRKKNLSVDSRINIPSMQEIAIANFEYMNQNSQNSSLTQLINKSTTNLLNNQNIQAQEQYKSPRKAGDINNGLINSIQVTSSSGKKAMMNKTLNVFNRKPNNDYGLQDRNQTAMKVTSVYDSIQEDDQGPDMASKTLYAGGVQSVMNSTSNSGHFSKKKMSAKFARDTVQLSTTRISGPSAQSVLTSPRDGNINKRIGMISQTPALKNVNFNNLPPLNDGKNKFV